MMREIERYISLETPHQMQILTNMLKAEKEGYDAFAVTCSVDPFLREGREMLSMPVVSISQTSFLFAMMLGDQFAVIASGYVLWERYRRLIVAYGLKDRYLPGPYLLDLSEEELAKALKEPEPVVEKFKTVARRAIDAGASVLIPLPAFISTCLYKAGITEVDGVLVLDPVAVLIKAAEAMVDLKAAGIEASRRVGHFGSPPKELRDRAMRKYENALQVP